LRRGAHGLDKPATRYPRISGYPDKEDYGKKGENGFEATPIAPAPTATPLGPKSLLTACRL